LSIIDAHNMLMESGFNWFSKDYGFNTRYGEVLIDLNVCNEWYKGTEKTK